MWRRCTFCILIIMIKWSVTQTLKWNHQKYIHTAVVNYSKHKIWVVILLFWTKILIEDTFLSFFLCCKVWCLHGMKTNKKSGFKSSISCRN
jgi:hypothetical protein